MELQRALNSQDNIEKDMKYTEQRNPKGQNTEWQFPRTGDRGKCGETA